MAKHSKSIYSALAANLLIAASKFIAGAFTNSSSMISEGIHSVVDTTNQLLLLYGLKRAAKPADKLHPFGYGRELYFWSFMVSIFIFCLGGGVSIYQGILHIKEPELSGDPTLNYVVLGLSLIFEGTSFIIALKEFNAVRGKQNTLWQAFVKSKDPSGFLVLFEDGAAVLGLLIVTFFMILSHALNLPYLDGVASVFVGLLLVSVSVVLGRECRSLLMGEGIGPGTQAKIQQIAQEDASVNQVLHIHSIYQSPEEIVLILTVAFNSNQDIHEINDAVVRLRENIKKEIPLVAFVIVQPQDISLPQILP